MIRVGSLFDISSINPEHIDNKSGMTASEQLDSIYQVIPGLVEKKRRIYSTVSTQLEKYGVKDVPYEELTEEDWTLSGSISIWRFCLYCRHRS